MATAAMIMLAVAAITLSGLEAGWKWAFVAVATVFGSAALFRYARPGIVRIARNESGWLLLDRQGRERPVALVGHSRRGLLLALEFSDPDRRHWRFLLTPDNLDRESRRRLVLTLAAGEPGPGAMRTEQP